MDYQQVRRLQADDTRRRIIDTAAVLIRQKGFQHMTVRDICRQAGVTTGAFYHHFSSKEELLGHGFSSLDDYLEEAMAPMADKPAQERLNFLLRAYAQYMEDMGWRVMSLYYGHRMAEPSAASISPDRFTLRAMAECFRELAQTGELSSSLDPDRTADFCFRHFRGVVIDWVLHRGEYSLWDRLRQDYQLFSQTLQA